MQSLEIFLSSGESLTPDEIMEGFLLLARNEAMFPMLSEQDRQIACITLVLETLAYNDEKQII